MSPTQEFIACIFRKKYMKTALQIPKNGTAKNSKATEHASKTTKKTSGVDKDLSKGIKHKCFENLRRTQFYEMLKRTEPLSKLPRKREDNKETKMSKMSKCHVFVKQVSFFSFFTVNHCGPLPLRELHSTDETIAWRDPGGS